MKEGLLLNIVDLLGEENKKRLQDGITDMLLEAAKDDINGQCSYIFEFDAIADEVKKEVEKEAKERMINKYIEFLEEKIGEIK